MPDLQIYQDIRALPQAGEYKLICIDPPWKFETYSKKGEEKSPQAKYPCMELPEISNLPLKDIAAKDCVVLMWATFPMLPQTLFAMSDWGFEYKSGGAWGKLSKTGRCLQFGTGHIFRSAAEPYILGSIGKPDYLSKITRNLHLAPVQAHSQKPLNFMPLLANLVGGPCANIFSRSLIKGWDCIGNELDKFPEEPHADEYELVDVNFNITTKMYQRRGERTNDTI